MTLLEGNSEYLNQSAQPKLTKSARMTLASNP
jgi:hypothetical protein